MDKAAIIETRFNVLGAKTPVYIYNKSIIEAQFEKLRGCLPDDFKILYAMKANPNKEIVSFIQKLGAGADIASGGELSLAMKAGYAPELITFAGPGKVESEIINAIKAGLAAINVEAVDELLLIQRCASKLSMRANVCVRINPKKSWQRSGLRMGGDITQFGITEEDLPIFFSGMKKCKNVDFRGVHIFAGSQILDVEVLLKNFKEVFEIARNVQSEFKKELSIINFGGGFGIPYFLHEKELDLECFKNGFAKLFNKYKKTFQNARFFVESGRFLVGPAGFYLTKILYKKNTRGTTYAITNGGINHHLTASGQLGSPLKRNFDIRILNKLDQPMREKVTIAGPLCTPIDILARNLEVPFIEPGDIVCILNSGAYAYSASPLLFLSHPFPKEILT